MKSKAQMVLEKFRDRPWPSAEGPWPNAQAEMVIEEEREMRLSELISAIVEDSIRTLDCFAVGEDLRTNPECCQLFMSEKQAEEYRRTWNPEGEWKIWPIAIYVEDKRSSPRRK